MSSSTWKMRSQEKSRPPVLVMDSITYLPSKIPHMIANVTSAVAKVRPPAHAKLRSYLDWNENATIEHKTTATTNAAMPHPKFPV